MPDRHLPADIQAHIDALLVHRHGRTQAAYMDTVAIEGYVTPGEAYRVSWSGLYREDAGATLRLPPAGEPPSVELTGRWDAAPPPGFLSSKQANILPESGVLWMELSRLAVPGVRATAPGLACYGAFLVAVESVLSFQGPRHLPVTRMEIGPAYASHYLLAEEQGGGAYLEHHDTPHFHMPLTPRAAGYLILGKQAEAPDGYRLTAFQIPYGYAVYTPPGVLHCDAFLVGSYRVVYTLTAQYATAFLRTRQGEVVEVEITPVL